MRIFLRLLHAVGLFLLLLGVARADYKEVIGWQDLQTLISSQMLNGNQLNGSGLDVAMIEAHRGGTGQNFQPEYTHSELTGKPFELESADIGSTSNHATRVARSYIGSQSIAPAVESIGLYGLLFNGAGWLTGDYLRTGAGFQNKPLVVDYKVMNHSWAGSVGGADQEVIFRTDWAVQNHGVVMVAGVPNESTESMNLLSSSFNTIKVGLHDGSHQSGAPGLFPNGRTVPDIVAPGAVANFTSYAAPVVSAAATLLVQAARSHTNTTEGGIAENPIMVRAFLMGGARKDNLLNNAVWDNSSTNNLDPVYGAGVLNVANSYRILDAGMQGPSTSSDVGLIGWNFAQSGSTQHYFFEVPEGYFLNQFSAFMTWNLIVDNQLNSASLATNLVLSLYSADGYTLVDLIDFSDSSGDMNHRLIYNPQLSEGRYAILIEGSDSTDFGLTWNGELALIPEPATVALLLGSLALLGAMRFRRERAPHAVVGS